MNNYKDTNRAYTLKDLFDLGLKLEVGDEVEHNGRVNFSEGREINFLASYNTPVNGLDSGVEVASSKQLDEYLASASESVEWENGDKCSYEADNDAHTFIGMTSNNKCCIRYDVSNILFEVSINEITKPETPEQKAERERLEAAYDLYRIVTVAHGDEAKTREHFAKFDYKDAWLAAIDEGYRKQ